MNINETPFVRFLLPLIAGIIVALYGAVDWPYWFPSTLFFILAGGAIFFLPQIRKKQTSWVFGVAIMAFLFFLGGFLTRQKTAILADHHIEQQHVDGVGKDSLLVVLNQPLKENKKSYSAVVRVKQVYSSETWKPISGKLLVYFEAQPAVKGLDYGDELIIIGDVREVSKPANPEQFDYKRYLYNHQVYHQTYVKAKDISVTGDNQGNIILSQSYSTQNYLVNKLAEVFDEGNSLSIASALLLGYRDQLDNDVVQTFSQAGAMHVLAVSGLHVGLIFLILQLLLKQTSIIRERKLLMGVLLVLGLWCYAFITGLSPSVMRAATMFSFVAVGQSLNRQSNIYNTLAASAFVLLIINPYLITQVGFQLSYAAVVGIVWLQPKIYKLIYVPNKWIDKLWQLTAVSIAAQIATFPLALYYFHQFPNYFLIANILVIPLATIILYLGIAFFLVSWIPYLSMAVGYLLKYGVKALFFFVLQLNELPYAVTSGVSINFLEVVVLYGFLIFLCWFLILRYRNLMRVSLLLLAVIVGLQVQKSYAQLNKQSLVVYDMGVESGIVIMNGKQAEFIGSKSLFEDKDKLRFYVLNHWYKNGYTTAELNDISEQKQAPLISYLDDKTLIFMRDYINLDRIKNIHFNWLVLPGNTSYKPEKLNELNFDVIIFDSSHSYSSNKFWVKEARKMGWKFHSVKTEGAYDSSW